MLYWGPLFSETVISYIQCHRGTALFVFKVTTKGSSLHPGCEIRHPRHLLQWRSHVHNVDSPEASRLSESLHVGWAIRRRSQPNCWTATCNRNRATGILRHDCLPIQGAHAGNMQHPHGVSACTCVDSLGMSRYVPVLNIGDCIRLDRTYNQHPRKKIMAVA